MFTRRNRSFCPKTRKWGHHYDKTTHRCECGAWERGFTPKKEPVRPRAECQICERNQALDRYGVMVHHGYERPGIGWIQGDCFGVKFKPYPATDALERYKVFIERMLSARRQELKDLETVEELPYTYEKGWPRKDREEITVQVKRGESDRYEGSYTIPSFDDLAERRKRALDRDIFQFNDELERVTKRIEKAKS